jgi:phosphonate transport system ATP-binding protein
MNPRSERERILGVWSASKAYGGRVALAPTTLEVASGERVAVVGPSGSGKTTLLHLMAGVIRPDSGDVALDGHMLSELRPGRQLAGLVGVIHQQFDLVPHLSVIHNVLAGRLGRWSLMRSVLSLVAPRDAGVAMAALVRVGLSDKLYEKASQLSGGEQQRVAIARMLVQDPRVIVADEPVASLDPARADDVMGLLATIAEESDKTLIASIHSIALTRRYFERVIGLRSGRVRFDLPVDEVTDEMLEGLYALRGLQGAGVSGD